GCCPRVGHFVSESGLEYEKRPPWRAASFAESKRRYEFCLLFNYTENEVAYGNQTAVDSSRVVCDGRITTTGEIVLRCKKRRTDRLGSRQNAAVYVRRNYHIALD